LFALIGLVIASASGCVGQPSGGVADTSPDGSVAPEAGPANAASDGTPASHIDGAGDAASNETAPPRTVYPAGAMVMERHVGFAFVVPDGVAMLSPTPESDGFFDAIESEHGDKVGGFSSNLGGLPGIGGDPKTNPLGAVYYTRQRKLLDRVEWDVFFYKPDRVVFAWFDTPARFDQFVASGRWTE
jgi:hypothetical protein